ncbi:MAG: acyltransferase [Prevotella sp.]|nr:acyltransferase [Prevotella sp.]
MCDHNQKLALVPAHLPYIGGMKFFLILGVVLIHCNYVNNVPGEEYDSSVALHLCNYVSSYVCRACVPCFFFLSAFLFFYGVNKFNVSVYISKLKKRVHTLLIPYLIWCTFCAFLQYFKNLYFGYSGYFIFDTGSIDLLHFLRGYWEATDGYPFAFAFWFIRNLIVFVIISPIAWLIGRSHWFTMIFMLVYLVTDIDFMGFEWFVAGSWFSLHFVMFKAMLKASVWKVVISSVLFWGIVITYVYVNVDAFGHLTALLQVASALYLTLCLSRKLNGNSLVNRLITATFMIYASHQCYCSLVRGFYYHLFGTENILQPLLAYTCTFLTLVLLGYLLFCLLKRYSPATLNLITGGR